MESLDLKDPVLRKQITAAVDHRVGCASRFEMTSCIPASDRSRLLHLWEQRVGWFTERSRHEDAAIAQKIVKALETVPEDMLYTAYFLTDGNGLIAWIDLRDVSVIAIDRNAVENYDAGVP